MFRRLFFMVFIIFILPILSCRASLSREYAPGWPVTISGKQGACIPMDIALDDNDEVFVSGIFYGAIDLDPGPGREIWRRINDYEAGSVFLAKYDVNGNYIWSDVSLYYPTQTFWNDIFVNESGNLFVAGQVWDITQLDSPDIPGRDNEGPSSASASLTKYDTDGNIVLNLQWGLTASSDGESESKSVVVNRDGDIFVAGGFYGEVDFDPGENDYFMTAVYPRAKSNFLASFSGDGQLRWVKAWGGRTGSEYIYDLEIDNNGDLYVTGLSGVFKSAIKFDSGEEIIPDPLIGSSGSYVIKFNDQGDLIWSNFWGGPGDADRSRGRSIALAESGNIYVLGYYFGSLSVSINGNLETFTSNGNTDIYLAALNREGQILWFKTWGSDAEDVASKILMNTNGDILCCGMFNGSIDLSPRPGFELVDDTENRHSYIASFDPNGNYQWSITRPYRISNFALRSDGLVFITGTYREPLEVESETGNYTRDLFGTVDGLIMPIEIENVGTGLNDEHSDQPE
ncbi:MAG: hypothetical protein NTY09_05025 [bacterium]|nr:hypothetical protein [bacterium]